MSLPVTLLILVVALAVAGLANWRERRARTPGEVPLVPYWTVQMVAAVVIILMLAHVVSLLTGTPLTGRLSR